MNSMSNVCSNRVLIDKRASKETIAELERLGIKIYKTTECKPLYNEVLTHADMQIHFVNGKAICAPEVYEYYKTLDLPDFELVCGSKTLKSTYPDDVAYNVCNIGEYVISRPLCTAIEIFSEYRSLKKKFLNARQGYAKCSICVVHDNSAITADKGMYKLLKENQINALLITEGQIELYRMTGFIGGASGLVNNTLLFNGDIKKHTDYENIKAFCKNVGVDIYSLNNGKLTDIGTIMQF